jgi:hypothetical protein
MSWRDDLPEIPTERIHGRVVREGGARRAAARRRRNTILTGAGVAAVGVLAVAGIIAVWDPPDDPNNGDAASTSPADTAAAEATSAATEAAEATTAETVAAEATAGADATMPFVSDVLVEPTTLWEAPVSGAACGPVALTVTATARDAQDAVVIVRSTNGLRAERQMILDGDLATAVIDSFPADTVEPNGREELLIEVVVTDTDGVRHSVAGPVVELLDCSS